MNDLYIDFHKLFHCSALAVLITCNNIQFSLLNIESIKTIEGVKNL